MEIIHIRYFGNYAIGFPIGIAQAIQDEIDQIITLCSLFDFKVLTGFTRKDKNYGIERNTLHTIIHGNNNKMHAFIVEWDEGEVLRIAHPDQNADERHMFADFHHYLVKLKQEL